jgi:hypothetical protein
VLDWLVEGIGHYKAFEIKRRHDLVEDSKIVAPMFTVDHSIDVNFI